MGRSASRWSLAVLAAGLVAAAGCGPVGGLDGESEPLAPGSPPAALASPSPQAAPASVPAPPPTREPAPQPTAPQPTPTDQPLPAATSTPRPAPPLQAGQEADRDSALVQHDPDLERLVIEALHDEPATFGVAIKELSTGRGLLLNAETELYAASLYKLPVMYEVFRQRAQGTLSLGETLFITERHLDFDLGTLDRGVGDRYSLGQALQRMITFSDNATAVMLLDRVGALRVNETMESLGMRQTFVLAERLATSPRDMLIFLETVARGEGIDPGSQAGMLHLLLHQRVRDRLPALLPPGTPVANKTGNWPGHVHDVGIVYGPDATVVIAVLTDEVQNTAAVTRAIARLASLVSEYFETIDTRPLPVPPDPGLSYPMLAPLPTPTPEPSPTPEEAEPEEEAEPTP